MWWRCGRIEAANNKKAAGYRCPPLFCCLLPAPLFAQMVRKLLNTIESHIKWRVEFSCHLMLVLFCTFPTRNQFYEKCLFDAQLARNHPCQCGGLSYSAFCQEMAQLPCQLHGFDGCSRSTIKVIGLLSTQPSAIGPINVRE